MEVKWSLNVTLASAQIRMAPHHIYCDYTGQIQAVTKTYKQLEII